MHMRPMYMAYPVSRLKLLGHHPTAYSTPHPFCQAPPCWSCIHRQQCPSHTCALHHAAISQCAALAKHLWAPAHGGPCERASTFSLLAAPTLQGGHAAVLAATKQRVHAAMHGWQAMADHCCCCCSYQVTAAVGRCICGPPCSCGGRRCSPTQLNTESPIQLPTKHSHCSGPAVPTTLCGPLPHRCLMIVTAAPPNMHCAGSRQTRPQSWGSCPPLGSS